MFDTEHKKLIATRIKTLRKSKNLSHQTLANELTQKYNIKISKDSLIQYEITDEYHAKWDKVKGMNIEYLYCIADYFKVSTDYLLGNTPNPTQNKNLDAVCNYTGLSEKAIESLVILKNKSDSRAYIDLLSCIIADCNFEYFLGLLEGYIVPNSQETTASFSMSSVTFNNKDICAFAASNALRNILENVEDEFLSEYQTTQDRLNILTKELYRRAGIQYNGNDK